MKVINLWGSPGAGKSKTAAGLFFFMKHAGFNVELVSEYAKMLTWEGRQNILKDQLYILAKQNRKLEPLREQVDWVITDSPLLLGLIYDESHDQRLKELVWSKWNSYDNVNFLLERANPYVQIGRSQTEAESDEIQRRIISLLNINRLPYHLVRADLSAPQVIMSMLPN